MRLGDIIPRWGGDEFTLLLPQISNSEEVIQASTRILAALENSFYLHGHELYISPSLGIAMLNEQSPNAETLTNPACRWRFILRQRRRQK